MTELDDETHRKLRAALARVHAVSCAAYGLGRLSPARRDWVQMHPNADAESDQGAMGDLELVGELITESRFELCASFAPLSAPSSASKRSRRGASRHEQWLLPARVPGNRSSEFIGGNRQDRASQKLSTFR